MFESAFDIKIKDYPLQYELVFETYNTYIGVNNILFSMNYIPFHGCFQCLFSVLVIFCSFI